MIKKVIRYQIHINDKIFYISYPTKEKALRKARILDKYFGKGKYNIRVKKVIRNAWIPKK